MRYHLHLMRFVFRVVHLYFKHSIALRIASICRIVTVAQSQLLTLFVRQAHHSTHRLINQVQVRDKPLHLNPVCLLGVVMVVFVELVLTTRSTTSGYCS